MSAQLYAQAAKTGISSLNLAMGGDNAVTIAAYNESYSRVAQSYAALDSKNAAESNMGAINQDKILTNSKIQMNQQQAEAAQQVSAATAGVSGQSVDAGIYQTGANASMAVATAEAKAEQLTEQQLAAVNSAQTTYNSIPDRKEANYGAAVLSSVSKTLGAMDKSDWAGVGNKIDDWTNSEDSGKSPTQYNPRSNNAQWSK